MKSIKFNVIVIILMSLQVCMAQRTNIAVLDLDRTGVSRADAQFLSDRLRTELFETGVYQVVEREKMEDILKEQGFQNTGCTSVECAVEIGQLLNVQAITAGAIGKIDDIYSISLRLIEVKTGAIMRTATEDYEGALSEVLTDVIPRIAEKLAEQQKTAREVLAEQIDTRSRYAISLKYGIAILGYTQDQNEAIDRFREINDVDLENFPNHSNVSLEGSYRLNEEWQLKAGLLWQSMFSDWVLSKNEFLAKMTNVNIERSYQLVNLYFGANYNFWRPSPKYRWYVGYDIGFSSLTSNIKQSYLPTSGDRIDRDDSYSYSKFTLKLDLGIEYELSRSFMLGVELGTQILGEIDTSGEEIPEGLPVELHEVLYPEKINASAMRFTAFLTYNF